MGSKNLITITPIIDTKFKQQKAVFKNMQPPVFAEKTDTFERSIPSFKGGEVNLHLPVAEIEKLLKNGFDMIKKEPDVIKKADLTVQYVKIIDEAHSLDIKGLSDKQEFFLNDRYHEFVAPLAEIRNGIINTIRRNQARTLPINIIPTQLDNAFEYMSERILTTAKRWEKLLDIGFGGQDVSAKEIWELALNSVDEKVKHNNVEIKTSGQDIFDEYKNTGTLGLYDYKLYTIFSNLIQNAVKYTKKGSTVNVKFEKRKIDNGNFLVFSVKDQGIGIPKNEQERVLTGERASNAISSGIEGTGYGLRRVFKVLDFNGGKLKIKSPLNPEDKEFPGTEVTAFIQLKD